MSLIRRRSWLIPLSCLFLASAGGDEISSTPAHPTRRLVKIVDTRDVSSQRSTFKALNIVVHDERDETREEAVEWSEPDYIASVASPSPHAAAPTYLISPKSITTSDPLFPWSLSNTNIQSAWALSKGVDEIPICIIDSGVDASHEDLQSTIGVGYDAILRQPGHIDTNGHGTMVAGILAASPDNQLGIPGVLWRGRVDACRFLGDDGRGYLSDAIECLRWCVVERNARVVSNSWGTYGPSRALRETMEYYAEAYGVMYVAAAGNEGVDNDDQEVAMYPASYNLSSIMSVAATTKLGALAAFSNYASRGESVDIAAPGVDTVSTFPGNKYMQMSGTSFAVPLVTGTLGLMLSSSNAAMSLTTSELKHMLLKSSAHSSVLDDWVAGGRFLDAYEAVRRAASHIAVNDGTDELDESDEPVNKFSISHPIYGNARVVDVTESAGGKAVKTSSLAFPGQALLNDSSLTGNIFARCPRSRYPRYDIRGLLADVLIPKHVFAVAGLDVVSAKFRYMQLDTCIMGGEKSVFDSLMVVLDCEEIVENGLRTLGACRCMRNNDGCGRRRAGSSLQVKISRGRRYVAVVFATDPAETGAYKLRARARRPR